ncbi:MAG: DNA-processing protein DprA [Alkalispirochaeta sp.]
MNEQDGQVNRYSARNEWRDRIIANALTAERPTPAAMALVKRYPSMSSLEQIHLLTLAPTPEALQDVSHGAVEQAIQRPLRGRAWRPRELLREAQQDLQWVSAASDHDLVWVGDARYPAALHRVFDAPATLYTWGDPAALHRALPAIAMVGTRHPDDHGRRGAFTLGGEAARCGFPVVSGLALGIDAATHRGVVAAGHGEQAVAVLGSGIDTVYPRRNREFAGAILDGGGILVSEYPPGTPPQRYQFPARNRIITGLSDALVLFQAPEGSGALITVEHALDIGLTIMAHVSGAGWTGVKSITDHQVRFVESIDHVVRVLRQDAVLPTEWRCPEHRFSDRTERFDAERLARFGPVESPESITTWRKQLQTAGGHE